jgi:hypothetical protein
MGETMNCMHCGAPLDDAPRPGRPAKYCGKGCRRAAELEVRRLNRAVETLEDDARWARISGRAGARRLAAITRELDTANNRLRALLAASEGEN